MNVRLGFSDIAEDMQRIFVVPDEPWKPAASMRLSLNAQRLAEDGR
jgi:hypothetical protein